LRRTSWLDWALAAALTLAALLELWLSGAANHHRSIAVAVEVATTSAVAVRRRYPLVAVPIVLLSSLQLALWGDPQILAAGIAYFCLLYALAVWTSPRQFVVGLAICAASGFAVALGPKMTLNDTALFTVVSVAAMVLVRRVLGDRDRRVQLAERERDLAAREAVVDEWARIARELHDAIAHDVSMMVVQAGAERHVARVLRTLNCRDRIQTVIYAYENGIVMPGELPRS
jgi:signal transduction histidine kinase